MACYCSNLLLICEGRGCSVVVHQQCYGVAKVPKGRWLCDACADKLSPAASNCACCPVVGGALRAVRTPSAWWSGPPTVSCNVLLSTRAHLLLTCTELLGT